VELILGATVINANFLQKKITEVDYKFREDTVRIYTMGTAERSIKGF
jgi:hypothetical protein